MIKPQTKVIGSYIILSLGIVLFITSFKTSILFNQSDSLPRKIYFLVKDSNWEKGDLVAINNFATQYTKDQHFTKRVVGVAGDLIKFKDDWVFINDKKIAKLKAKTKDNKKLNPIREQMIPQQYFFVIAEHKDSFDSRYQEFGLVNQAYIEGKVYAIW